MCSQHKSVLLFADVMYTFDSLNQANDLARGTISRFTDEATSSIGTALSSPETARPIFRDIDRTASTRIKLKASEIKSFHPVVSQYPGPNLECTFIFYSEDG